MGLWMVPVEVWFA